LTSAQRKGAVLDVSSSRIEINRLQPCRISVKNTGTAPTSCADATAGNVMDFTYGFNLGVADNGNAQSIANNINTARSQTYTYDELNRVTTAKTSATSGVYSWGLSFTYDPWANLLSATVTQGSGVPFSGYADGNNRLRNTAGALNYDAAGNLTSDPTNSAPNSYTYNAEGELASAAGVTYSYDGDGSRVKKSTGKLYWYGLGSDPLS
jgi:YD repeat-containing protein